jgi:uncharacterized phage-associated protein
MKAPISPLTGKPMRVVYEPDTETYRGEKYDFIYVSFRDDAEGESYTTTESDGVWLSQVTNQYRAKHGIPYTDEIIALRERYGLSASKMSVILGFGANQYRLYEMGEVPSESNGKMIRSAMNPKVFLDLVKSSRHQLTDREYDKIVARMEEVIAKSGEWHSEQWVVGRLFRCGRGVSNGFAPLSTERLKNLLLYILGKMGDTFQTKMNKVLFYIDFLSYRERGMAISGLAYNAIDFGPVPQRWDRVYSAFDEVEQQTKLVHDQECVALTATAAADMGRFTTEEKAIIDEVCEKMKGLSAHDISDLSHREPAWKNHLHQAETIPYSEAFSLVGM